MHNHFRAVVGTVKVRADEIDLGLYCSKVLLRAALQNEARAQLGQVRNSRNIQKDVLRQDCRQSGENLFAAPALALEVHDVGLHEHRAAISEDRHGAGGKCYVGILLDLVAERLGGALQEVSISCRTLRVQLKVFYSPILEHNELDVLPANVHDHMRVFVELHRRLSMRYSFDQCDISLQHVFQHVFGVAGRSHSEHFECCTLRLNRHEHVDCVLDGVAVRELIRFAQHLTSFREQHRLRRGRAAVDADESLYRLASSERLPLELRYGVLLFELRELFVGGTESCATRLRLFRLAADSDVVLETLRAEIDSRVGVFVLAELHRADCSEILCVVWNLDEVFRLGTFGQLHLALFPHFGDVLLPGFLHAAYKAVRTAEQQHMRTQGVAARQHGQILQHNGIEQRRHKLIRRDSLLLQAIDVSLGEDAALSRYRMQLDSRVALVTQLFGGNLQLGVDLVDDGARTPGALVVHRRDLLLAPCILVLFEDYDLGILPAELDH